MVKKMVVIPCITVTAGEANHLINCVVHAKNHILRKMPKPPHVLDDDNRSIIISINGKWQPFVGCNKGYNPENERVYLPGGINILDDVIVLLKDLGLDIPGGRIFINQYMAFMKDGNLKKTICTFNWEGGDPYLSISRN